MKHKEACELLTAAIAVDPSNKSFNYSILYRRGVVNLAYNRLVEACNDFTSAMRLNETSVECLMKRAEGHFKLNEFENCITDLDELLMHDKNHSEAKRLINNAKKMSIVSRHNWFDTLGVSKFSSKAEVRKAFHKLSLLYHPDKHPQATAVEKRKLERKLREINEAYEKAKRLEE